jgi:hypothetical protein
MIHEPRRRFHQDVLALDHRHEKPLRRRQSLGRFLAQHSPASIDDDFTGLNASRCENALSVNWRVMYDDDFQIGEF